MLSSIVRRRSHVSDRRSMRHGEWERRSTSVFASILNTAKGKSRNMIPANRIRSEEHTSELQSLMRISYAVFCLKKKKVAKHHSYHTNRHDSDNNAREQNTKKQ